ncbi:MAG: LytTR family DNA-binding domain-containing protein [Spirosomaceae bacterium]|jgi:two-component system LytT family response regulator|nr:LytTR family DNA-binding domain-containing protein [Spirosomataceae bacterium]
MNTLKAILVDDEPNAVDSLAILLNEFCKEIQIVGKANTLAEAQTQINETDPDIVFLDIEMPNGSGFDLLTLFPNPSFKVIFVTAYDRYAINAIKFSALDYLLKPVAVDDLKEAVAKAFSEIKDRGMFDNLKNLVQTLQNPRNRKNKITIPTQMGIELVEVESIIRCESARGFTILHLPKLKTIVSSRDLKSFQELLEEYDFYRVHDSHLVSYYHIERVLNKDGGVVLTSDNFEVPIARRRKNEFIEWLRNF